MLGCILYACDKTEVKLPIVNVENLETENINIYGDYVGLIKASKDVEVHARVEGFLEKMNFNEGKKVKAGEALFILTIDNIGHKQIKQRLNLRKMKLKKPKQKET